MGKKILSLLLILILALPVSANAAFSDDINNFKQKYADIYQQIDPNIALKMDMFLPDVVDYVIRNYDKEQSVDIQIKNAIGSTLLTGETYKNDLLPFMVDQSKNKESYRAQLNEMQTIVRNEVMQRVNSQAVPTNPPSGAGGSGGVIQNPVDKEIAAQLSQANRAVSLKLDANQTRLSISQASMEKILSGGHILGVHGPGVSIYIKSAVVNLPANSAWTLGIEQITPLTTDSWFANLPQTADLIGPVYEFTSWINDSPITQFNNSVLVDISYNETDLRGIAEERLNVWYYNESIGQWQKMKSFVNQEKNYVSFSTIHFSKYAVMADTEAKNQTVVAQTVVPVSFNDINGHWAKPYIEQMAARGLISGVAPGMFQPDRNITRAEFSSMLLRTLEVKPVSQVRGKFLDVAADKWYFDTINTAASIGLINGYSATCFGPNDPVTREQVAVMISNAMRYKGRSVDMPAVSIEENLKVFNDASDISIWARIGVAVAVQEKIIQGRGNSLFAPLANATRAEAAVMLLKMK